MQSQIWLQLEHELIIRNLKLYDLDGCLKTVRKNMQNHYFCWCSPKVNRRAPTSDFRLWFLFPRTNHGSKQCTKKTQKSKTRSNKDVSVAIVCESVNGKKNLCQSKEYFLLAGNKLEAADCSDKTCLSDCFFTIYKSKQSVFWLADLYNWQPRLSTKLINLFSTWCKKYYKSSLFCL